MTDQPPLTEMLRTAFIAGFLESYEGFNGEWPFGLSEDPSSDPTLVLMADEWVNEALADLLGDA